jgi:DNA-binding XRE family transcriptional regulator
MSDHICRQCIHYQPNDKPHSPNGQCGLLRCPVWSRRPECASKTGDMFQPRDTLGSRLRMARVAAGLSRDDVCSELELNGFTLQSWENGKREPPVHTQKMIFEFYNSKTK